MTAQSVMCFACFCALVAVKEVFLSEKHNWVGLIDKILTISTFSYIFLFSMIASVSVVE